VTFVEQKILVLEWRECPHPTDDPRSPSSSPIGALLRFRSLRRRAVSACSPRSNVGSGVTKSYEVIGKIYPFGDTEAFEVLPAPLTPAHACSFEIVQAVQQHLRRRWLPQAKPWTIKGMLPSAEDQVRTHPAKEVEAGFAADPGRHQSFLPRESDDRHRRMVLLERRTPCDCQDRWRPRHDLRIVYDPSHRDGRSNKPLPSTPQPTQTMPSVRTRPTDPRPEPARASHPASRNRAAASDATHSTPTTGVAGGGWGYGISFGGVHFGVGGSGGCHGNGGC
jgi:hypothetical protein